MKIGISALIFNLEEAIKICKENKQINHIELGIDNLEEYKILLDYKDQIIENNITIGIHLPMELNSCENITYIRKSWVDYIMQSFDKLNNNIKIEYFNMHLGYVINSRLQKNKDKYLQNSVDFFEDIPKNMTTQIYIENVYSNDGDICNVGNTLYDFNYIFNKNNNIKFCYDTGHNLINKDNYIQSLKSKIELVHLSDNDGISDLHLGLKKGIIKDEEIKQILDLKPKYIVLEMNHEYVKESLNIITNSIIFDFKIKN